MSDWNPELYLKFKSERTQPSIDLIARVNCPEPKSIIDIGCGPGNSTQMLVNRWPNSRVTGLDNSASMIEKVRADYPNQEWVIGDAAEYTSEDRFDVVFSNAAIQWIPDHQALLSRLTSLLSDRGILAIQVPLFWDMDLGKIIRSTAVSARWSSVMEDVSDIFTMHGYAFYYDLLSDLFPSLDIWQTDYMHVLDNHEAILEMMRSTGLRPYHEKLDAESDKEAFENDVLEEIVQAYPAQKNKKVILPFKRLFFIGYK